MGALGGNEVFEDGIPDIEYYMLHQTDHDKIETPGNVDYPAEKCVQLIHEAIGKWMKYEVIFGPIRSGTRYKGLAEPLNINITRMYYIDGTLPC